MRQSRNMLRHKMLVGKCDDSSLQQAGKWQWFPCCAHISPRLRPAHVGGRRHPAITRCPTRAGLAQRAPCKQRRFADFPIPSLLFSTEKTRSWNNFPTQNFSWFRTNKVAQNHVLLTSLKQKLSWQWKCPCCPIYQIRNRSSASLLLGDMESAISAFLSDYVWSLHLSDLNTRLIRNQWIELWASQHKSFTKNRISIVLLSVFSAPTLIYRNEDVTGSAGFTFAESTTEIQQHALLFSCILNVNYVPWHSSRIER